MYLFFRKGFELLSVATGHREEILSLESEPSDIQVCAALYFLRFGFNNEIWTPGKSSEYKGYVNV